jgi:hypothetical protein
MIALRMACLGSDYAGGVGGMLLSEWADSVWMGDDSVRCCDDDDDWNRFSFW